MSELDAPLDALAFFRTWKATFLTAVDASDKGARAAEEAVGRAELLVGRLADAPLPTDTPSQADALLALEESVALLEAFEAARKRHEAWLGWIGRATPDGPLAAWKVDAERSRPRVERLLAEAEPAGIAAARAELEAQLTAVSALADGARERLQDARGQLKSAVDTFDQAVRILGEDVQRMEDDLDAVRALDADAQHGGIGPLVGMGMVAGAAFGMAGWFGGGEDAGLWATCAGGGALVLGLLAGLWRWGGVLGEARRHLAALDLQARGLQADLDGARTTVLSELAAASAAWDAAARDAGELRIDVGRFDATVAFTRVGDPAVVLPLDGLRARIAEVRISDRRWWAAAAGVGAVAVAVGLGMMVALDGTASGFRAAAEPEGETPSSAEAAVTGAPADELDRSEGASAEAAAVEEEPPATTKATARPAALAAGAWRGTMGLATVEGTLSQEGGTLSGSFTLTEPGAAPRVCTANGTTTAGGKVRLTLGGCPTPARLEGTLRDGGRALRGKARSTGTGAFAGAEIVDVFELSSVEDGE